MIKLGIDTAIMSCLALFATLVTMFVSRRIRIRMNRQEVQDLMATMVALATTMMVVGYMVMVLVLDSWLGSTGW